MRINVYSQELITDILAPNVPIIETVSALSNTGLVYSAVRLFLHSSDRLHHPPADDDRSAISFWLPKTQARREAFARTLELLAAAVRQAAPETGLD